MIVLDTNVISEFARPLPSEKVKAWILQQDGSRIWLCTVGLMEQIYGAERAFLKTGSDRFFRAIENLVKGQFRDRIVGWDLETAMATGRLRAKRENMGRPISVRDAMIAAICLANGATLATRNTRDFEGLDLKLVNPFEDG
ncbi:type II toxin-antitoxin system VapC family toxin [Rhizobium laguerreae]|uniref:type II toxin-antitoxin system VapC family toxin n=1 Tax=Rhizobium laguerreae TaxID=1076926 RepID=UPI001441EA69|nr:type II toxin-antitoxin system VapC family toxin [Rhizobium laguerreae]MBY3037393.1 type II toxin-antitoxin system VapC family toxin [Rhizobium laguerreae]MBY3213132.1 type II toxin-antitoxin system VapC family toxin [Rhizobium laguerreae]MBY3334483.1 type II toxin-antitoxin system VapC family toxin [Rhizobium laguerreae]NKN11669.1 PIN domain-containing protein [Rhizobium laguerreae]